MLVDISETLYVAALARYRTHFSKPDEQLEFWGSLGKAALDNPGVSPALISQLLLTRMAKSESGKWRTKVVDDGPVIAESEMFAREAVALPEGAKSICDRAIHQLAKHPGAGTRLFGELEAFSLFQWNECAQLFQIGYVAGTGKISIVLIGLGRQYVGV